MRAGGTAAAPSQTRGAGWHRARGALCDSRIRDRRVYTTLGRWRRPGRNSVDNGWPRGILADVESCCSARPSTCPCSGRKVAAGGDASRPVRSIPGSTGLACPRLTRIPGCAGGNQRPPRAWSRAAPTGDTRCVANDSAARARARLAGPPRMGPHGGGGAHDRPGFRPRPPNGSGP